MTSYDIYLFHYSSFNALIGVLNRFNIPVKKYYEYGNDYYLKIPRRYRKRVYECFKSAKIVSKMGIINYIEEIITKPIILVSLVLSLFLFFDLSNRLYDIEFNGNYEFIENEMAKSLSELGLYKWGYLVDEDELEKIENGLKERFNKEVESLELYKRGNKIIVNYKKRRTVNDYEESKGSLYATKDGVIVSFDISKGVKKVGVNDFVRKGDILVSDTIVTSGEEGINVGSRGSVYAYTYYFIEVINSNVKDEVSLYSSLVDAARYEVGKNINSDKEYIKEENILISDLKSGYMKVYYVLYEDITI